METLEKKTRIKLVKANNLSLTEAFERYQINGKLRNLTEVTLQAQRDKFKKFYKFLGFDKSILIKDIDSNVIDPYIQSLLEEDIKISSVNIYIKYLKIFINYCANNNYCKPIEIKLLKADEELKEGYSDSQLKVLLQKPDITKASFADFRNWTMINFLIATGVRRTTLVNIKIGDLDFDNDIIILRKVKNRRQQLIPISLKLREVLLEYLSFRHGNTDNYLFVNSYGEKFVPEGANKMLRNYNAKLGIETLGLHGYRRAFATTLIRNNTNLFVVSKLMGHSSVKTTEKYVKLTINDIKDSFKSPLDIITDSENKKKFIKLKK